MRERLINRRQQGDLGEASAIEWLARQGATVLLPFGHSPDYDLVADLAGRLIRVQVKTSVARTLTSHGQERWSVAICTNGGNQSWTGMTKRFDPAKTDFLFVLVGDGRRWFIPSAAAEATNALAVGGMKYSEFEIEPGGAITDLVYAASEATLKSEPRAGEYPSGQRTAPVKRQAHAFAGSNPASPISATPEPVGSSFERKLGRAGQAIVRPKRQMTIPARPYTEAGLQAGDRIRFRADGPGRVILERIEPPATIFDAA